MIKRSRVIIDAKGQILGRLSTKIAGLLIGKHKVDYRPNLDMGDFVVIINSDSVKVSGKKELKKVYYRHSGYPGGFKALTLQEQRAKDSRRLIEHAVTKMLPKNKLRAGRLNRLRVFKGSEHPYGKN